MKRLSAILLVGALVFGTVGCTNMNKTQQGLLSGAAGGAILGAGLGALTGGSGTTGALIGGGLGALAGGIYGHSTKDRTPGSAAQEALRRGQLRAIEICLGVCGGGRKTSRK